MAYVTKNIQKMRTTKTNCVYYVLTLLPVFIMHAHSHFFAGLSNSSIMKNTAVTAANIHNVTVNPITDAM